MKEKLKKLFCKHHYQKIAFREVENANHSEIWSERLYKCEKCGKEIWVDGRFDRISC